MIKSIRGIASRFFKNNKLIALTSIVGVMISISLIITMVVFVSNAKQSLVQEVEKMYGKMDLAIGYNPEQDLAIDEALSHKLSEQDGVITTSKILLTHYLVDEIAESYYTVGVENDELSKSRYQFTQNINKDEVSLNTGLASLLNVTVGDSVLIEGQSYTVKELLPDLEAAGKITDILLLNREAIAQLELAKTGSNKQADYMLFEVSESTDVYALAQTIQNIDPELRVDIATEDEFMKSNLDLLYQFMIGLSILVMIITALFIISNFELFLYKYKHELAVMRSIGASRWQVFKIILLQSTFINLLGGLCALTFSLLTYNYLQKGFAKVFSLEIDTLHFEFGIAVIVALISMAVIQMFMLIPAYRSSRLLPITIMQENEAIDFPYRNLRKKLAFTILGVSVFLVLTGAIFTDFRVFIVPGSVGILLSSISFIPLYLSAMLGGILPLVRRFFGNISFVSLKNTIPQVRKNTFIVLIISAMMIIVVFGSTFIQTIQKNDEAYIKKQYETEIVITNRLSDNSNIDATELTNKVTELDSVESVSTQSKQDGGEIRKGSNPTSFDYFFADIVALSEQKLIDTLATSDKKGIIVTKDFAKEHQLNEGDTLDIAIQSDPENEAMSMNYLQDGEVTITDIVASFPYPNEYNDILIDWKTPVFNPSFKSFDTAFIEVNDPQLALQELEGLKGIYPEIQVNSLEQSLEQSKEMALQRWVIFIVVLVVILLSTMFGVINTLINNINSKRKEFAVLRVVFMNRKNIIQVITTQITAYIMFGILLGISLGMIFTYLVSLVDPGPLSFNWTLITAMSIITFIIAYIILVPFANRLGKLNISEELMQDNK